MNQAFDILGRAASRDTADKAGLADRYMVGIRTIEGWMSAGIIEGTRRGKRIVFDVAECDGRLRRFNNQKEIYGNN